MAKKKYATHFKNLFGEWVHRQFVQFTFQAYGKTFDARECKTIKEAAWKRDKWLHRIEKTINM